jgi:hypothetical protein
VFLEALLGQAVGGELDLMVLIGGAEERAAIQLEMSVKSICNFLNILNSFLCEPVISRSSGFTKVSEETNKHSQL